MAQFNAPKNPPWVRAESYQMQQVAQQAMQPQMMTTQLNPAMVQYQQTPTQQAIYSTQLALQQQAMSMQQIVANSPQVQQLYNQQLNSVAAAVARPLSSPFVQPVVAPSQGQGVLAQAVTAAGAAGGQSATATKQRVFTGTVTKVVETYGFVDEDVFFQMTVVKGPTPIVNDRVLVEAVCLPNMPFKWNATRIQVLPMNEPTRGAPAQKKSFVVSNSNQDRSGYNAVPPPGEYDEGRQRDRDIRDRGRRRSRERSSQVKREDEEAERRRRRERREKEDREREEKKERDRVRSRSPKKPRAAPVVRKYRVRVPEHPLDVGCQSVCELRARYRTMYVPSDVFRATPRWQETFAGVKPLTNYKTAHFHIMSKDVDPVFEYSDNPEAPDADLLFSAKVMLLSMLTMEELMKKCMVPTEEMEKDDGRNVVHPSRLINCLVGLNTRGKNDLMPIGGAWSPSLDGADPAGDPTVLIKTAIRTCKALTGIDLTPCTQWYRFVEVYYHRAKTTHKGKDIPARVETVVIYVPDVWTAMPSCLEYDGLQLNMRKQFDRKQAEASKADAAAASSAAANSEDEKEEVAPSTNQPTHYSQLDPKLMTVSDLREELAARNMSSKGLRLQLIARLTKQLKTEQETEELDVEKKGPQRASSVVKEEDKKTKEQSAAAAAAAEKNKKKDVKEKPASLEEKFILPETPHILVHPSRVAKGGKFRCKLTSLSILLDYSSDTSKEQTFEVSLFAELFHEMLMRHFGLEVFKAVVNQPDVKEDEEKKDEKEDDEKKDKTTEKEEGKDEEKEATAKETEDGTVKNEEDEKEEKKEDVATNGKSEKDASKDISDDENSRDSRDRDRKDRKERERDKKKAVVPHYTANKKLLLAFSYFDVSHYGRISGTHLEDLIHTLGLHLSRAQVKKLVSKVLQRDYCDYRKLTDLPVGTEPPLVHLEEEELTLDQMGNKALLPVFQMTMEKKEKDPVPAKRARRGAAAAAAAAAEKEKESDKIADGFVNYKGALVNIENLKTQASQNHDLRLETESKLIELNKEIAHLKERLKREGEEVKNLNRDLRNCRSKLSGTETKLDDQKASADIFLTALMDIEERLVPILDTDEVKRLIKIRQSVLGTPSINLVPLTKVEDIEGTIKDELLTEIKTSESVEVKDEKMEDD